MWRSSFTIKSKRRRLAVKPSKNLTNVFAFAIRNELMDSNPCRELPKLPAEVRKPDKEEDKKHYLTIEQIDALLGATEEPKYQTLFTVAVWTGLREGELLGLQWKDFKPKKRVLRIPRTCNHGKDAKNINITGAPRVIRTCDLRIRRPHKRELAR